MKFGQVREIDTHDGPVVVMIVAEDENPFLADAGIASAVTLSGFTNFVGNSPKYPPGRYGPGDIGPVKVEAGRLVDDSGT